MIRLLTMLLIWLICTSQSQQPLAAGQQIDDELPWKQNNLSDRKLPFSVADSTTAEQMLEILGVGESELRFLIDFDPVAGKDIDTIGNLLSVFPKLSESDIRRWANPTQQAQATPAKPAVTLQQISAATDEHRVRFFSLRGRAVRVQRQPIVAEAARLTGFGSFFWVFIEPDQSDISVRIATRKLPIAWFPESWKRRSDSPADTATTPDEQPSQFEINEPVSVDGLLLKIAEEDDQRELVMAATRVKWLPTETSDKQDVNRGMVLLSQFGFDAGLIDEIRRTNGRQLELADREAFYQIMEILQLPGQQQAIQASHREGEPAVITITDYLKNPRSLQGQFVTIAGDVRQISRVAIVNSKMQRRLGRDHYWQLDLSIPIGDEAIQLKSNAADKEGLIFRNRYPVQVCIADLPPTLRQAMDDIRLGIDQRKLLREPVTIQGVFFKLWSYQSGRTIRSGANRVQLSPLIIASHITVHPENITDRAGMGTYVAIIFIGGMALIAVFLIRMGRQDRDAHQRTAATRHGHNNSQPLDFESN